MSETRTFAAANPRHIVVASAEPLVVVWVEDDAEVDGSPTERLRLWTAGDAEPRTLVARSALGEPTAACVGETAALVVPVRAERGWACRVVTCRRGRVGQSDAALLAGGEAPGRVTACRHAAGLFVVRELWSGGIVTLRAATVDFTGRDEGVALPVGPLSHARDPALGSASGGPWLVWLEAASPAARYAVKLWRVGGAAPAATVAADRGDRVGPPSVAAIGAADALVAWHTSRRPAGGTDLTRWLEVRLVRGGVSEVPLGRPLNRRWGALGEDQGLEYPLLFPRGPVGAGLVARSAHRHWVTALGRGGWSPLAPIDAEGWGCRSRLPGFAIVDDGVAIVAAWRERQHVRVERVEIGSLAAGRLGGRPSVAPGSPRARRTAHRPRLCAGTGRPVFFGDIHQHTARSDGLGTVREAYLRARHHYGDDFVAVTDHESFLGKRQGPGEWRQVVAECDLHDEPGRFVTLHAYEWTGARHPGPGHRCVYWPHGDLALLGRDAARTNGSAGLIAVAKEHGGLVFPHHVGWTGADSAAHDAEVQTCWEVVSCHGAYEALGVGPIGQRDVPLPGHFLRDQLDRGLRFGFVGGSDGHGLLWHHGVSRKRDSHRTGLTAVYARDLTRGAVFAALRARHCYATSGAKMLLDFAVEGVSMGGVVGGAGSVVRAHVEVDSAGAPAFVELIGAGGFAHRLADGVRRFAADVDVDVPEASHRYLYLRAERVDGEVAWSSPVWLEG